MSNRRVHPQASSVLRRRSRKANESLKTRRKLQLEFLEDRKLLAVGPRLVAVEPNVGEMIEQNDVLHQPPDELKLVFDSSDVIDPATLGTGILMFRSGGDGTFADGNEVPIVPAFAGVGTARNEVFLRFAQTLPDDAYQLRFVGTGTGALRDVNGNAFGDTTNDNVDNGVSFTLAFELQLGAQIISVVPQPVTRDPSTGVLTQAKNQIDVYFNESDLDAVSVSTPAYYRLIDTRDQSLLFPSSVSFEATEGKATLFFPSDLSTSTYQLQIGATEESNDSIGNATDLGTIIQQATAAVYDSPVVLDADGNEVPLNIPDGGSVISAISVTDSFFISDVNVEVDIDHEWGPDLRVYLRGPGGQRVELIRDLGSQVRGGQIYGVKYNDLNSNSVRDTDEPGLPGWTIFIDVNNNGELDPSERSTVTDADGKYSFVNLPLNQSYKLVEIPQILWQPISPNAGAPTQVYGTDFSDGSVQTLTIVGNATDGTFRLGFAGRSTSPIDYAGATGAAATAANIEQAVATILDPGFTVSVTPVNAKVFTLRFTLRGVGTTIDHPALSVVDNQLDVGQLQVTNAGDASGYTSDGDLNLWRLSSGRGNQPGHTPQFSFYFGQNETDTGGGTYPSNADGTLRSPQIDLTDPTITGPITLRLNHFLESESGFDFATISVLSEGQSTQLFSTSGSTGGFVPVSFDLSQFAGQRIQLEFNFQSDFVFNGEGWYVDDIRIETERPARTVSLVDAPLQRIANDIDFGSSKTPSIGPDGFGYQAYQVPTNFEDIAGNETARRILQQFTDIGRAVKIGSTGDDIVTGMAVDSVGNVILAGSFQGTVNFDVNGGTVNRTSAGGNDAFVAKYAPNGNLLWVQAGGGISSDVATSVVVDGSDNIILGGSFSQNASFGGNSLASSGSTDALIWKLNSAGATLWVRGIGGSAIDETRGVDVNALGQVHATGFFSGTVDFDSGAGTQNLASLGSTDAFVLRLTSTGDFSWVRQIGGTGADRGEAIHITPAGNVTTTGSFSGTVDFNPAGGNGNIANRTSAGSTDGFVQQMTDTGAFRWANRFGGTGSDFGNDVTSDTDGEVHVTGINNGDIYVERYNANGASQWVRNIGGGSTDSGESIFVESDGTVTVAGSFRVSVDFGAGNIDSAGGSDAFVLTLNDQGVYRAVKTYGGTLDDVATRVIVEDVGSFVVAGSFRGTASFDVGRNASGASIETLTSNGGTDGFLVRVARPQGVDDATAPIASSALDGFRFNFYGNSYDGLFVSSNGIVTFTNSNNSSVNSDLLITPNEPTIAAFWEDLRTGSAEVEAVFWDLIGEPGDRRLIVQWNNVRVDNAAANLIGPLDFQAVLKERDGSIQFNYRTIADPQAVQDGAEFPVGTFEKGVQRESRIAVDANGNYVVVWASPGGQDGAGSGIYARRYNAGGVPFGAEFLVNQTTDLEQQTPSIAMNASGRFVVVWSGNGPGGVEGIVARVFDATASPVTDEFLVNTPFPGTKALPDVGIDVAGNFVVGWQGPGSEDADGVYLRRFTASGQPIGLVDEIQRVRFQGPPVDGSAFTLIHDGEETGQIVFTTVANQLATRIENALIALPGLSDQVQVVALPSRNEVQELSLTDNPVVVNEVQTFRFSANTTSGTVTLNLGGTAVGPIVFAGVGMGAVTAANIEAALVASGAVVAGQVVVAPVSGSDFNFSVTFTGVRSGTDVPLMTVTTNNLNPGATLTISETVKGTAGGSFTLSFLGVETAQIVLAATPAATAANIQAALVALANIGAGNVTVVPVVGSTTDFRVTFQGTLAGTDVELLVLEQNNLDRGSLDITEVTYGATSGQDFEVQFLGPDGGQDQPLLSLGEDQDGVTHLEVVAKREGSDGQLRVNNIISELQAEASVEVAPDGSMIVSFTSGEQDGDGAGVFAKRYDANGVPIDPEFDELQRIQLLGPLGPNTRFSLQVGTATTGLINYAGPNSGSVTAANIQAAFNALPEFADVIVTADRGTSNEIQEIVFTQGPNTTPNGGTFRLSHRGQITAPITYAGNAVANAAATATNIQNALRALANTDALLTVIPVVVGGNNSPFRFTVTFLGTDGGIDHPTMVPTDNQLNQGSLSVITIDEGGKSGDTFLVQFSGDAGRQDQPDIELDNNRLGVTSIVVEELVKGHNSEFQVNVEITNEQRRARAVRRADGSFFVVWDSELQDGDSFGIFAKLYAANGDVLRDEFQVNTFTQSSQTLPSAGVDSAGNLYVVWQSFDQDGDGEGIYGRKFGADGFAIGDEFEIATLTGGDQVLPSIAVNGDGSFVVSWGTEAGEGGIHTQRFSSLGLKVGAETQVSQFGSRNQTQPEVARSAGGNYVVVWTDIVRDSDISSAIYAQVFDSNSNPISGEILVNQTTARDQRSPSVAIDDMGRFVIVWTSSELDADDLPVSTIRGRQFNANGTPATNEFQISDGQVFAASLADVDIAPGGGRWAVTWTQLAGPNTTLADVAVVGKTGAFGSTTQSGILNLLTSTSVNGFITVRPRIAVAFSGDFGVVTTAALLTDTGFIRRNVFGRLFGADGTPKVDAFLVHEGPEDAASNEFNPDISVDSFGRYRPVWLSSTLGIMLGSVDANGNVVSTGVSINDNAAGTAAIPRIDIASDDSFHVTWFTSPNTFVQRFASDGTAIGNNLVTANRTQPAVAASDSGFFTLAYLNGSGVFVQSFSTDLASVGIKDAGTQSVGQNVLQIWVDGSSTQLVGPNTSTRISVLPTQSERLFAVSATNNQIVELNPTTGSVIRSFPAPRSVGADAGLAYAGGTLYFIASNDDELFELDPDNGAIVDSMMIAGASVDGLAVLNGEVVLLDGATGELVFVDPFENEVLRRLTPAVAISNGLAGGGSRGTLLALDSQSRIVELNSSDGAVVDTYNSPAAGLVGLAFVSGVILASGNNGVVHKIDPDSGNSLGTLSVPAGLSGLGADGGGGVLLAAGGDYQPLVNTILDDEATQSILEGVGPYTGRFRPVEPLSAFDATNARGSWRLEIEDAATGNTGVLNGWRLYLNEQQDTPPDASLVGFIGDNLDAAVAPANDVDLYRFELLSGGSITVNAIPDPGLNIAIRLFDAQGNVLRSVDAAGIEGAEQLVHVVGAAGTYYIGLSSSSNINYTANGSNASGGTTTGSYRVDVRFSEPLLVDDDNSSYDTATPIGPLGVGGTMIRSEIRNAPLTFRMPGPIDEPGHRDIPVESHLLGGGASGSHKGQIILSFKEGVSEARQTQILNQNELELIKEFDFIGAKLLGTRPGADLNAVIARLSGLAEIRYAEPDRVRQTTAAPNDPLFVNQWHYDNTGQTGGTIDADIDLPEAWDTFTGSSQVVIAAIDTGVDLTHPDLVGNLWVNPGEIAGDGIDNDGNGYADDIHGIDPFAGDSDPQDEDGHGTHVAGTTAAVGDNGIGVTGVNWNAKIMALRVGDLFLPDSAIIESLNYIVTMKTVFGINIVVSNNSYGGGGFSQATFDAIQANIAAGVGYVAASGNDGSDNDAIPQYPASYDIPEIISVAATDDMDQLAGFSNFGLQSVDIAAPGVDIVSTTLGGGYGLNSGTSMASPHVTGVYALLAGFNRAASVSDIRDAILIGSDPLPNLTGTSVTGARLNASTALTVLGTDTGGVFGAATKTAFYNFQDVIGVLPSGAPALNAITDAQIERAREIFEIYSQIAGIQFIETDNEGMTIATGDMRALDPTVQGGPGGVAGIAGGGLGGLAIMDGAEDWGDSEYGGGWFGTAMHEIGHLLGLGHTYDLPNLTVMGGFGAGEPIFPGDHDIIHVRFVHPPGTMDQDLYEFTLNESGIVTVETIAERIKPNASLLDTSLSLYRETEAGERELIANNDDYYSNDSFLRLHLPGGKYFVSVTASNNSDLDPAISDTGFGGTSTGDYELRLNFQPDAASSMVDVDQVAVDGDADGAPGGRFNFFFETGHTIFVDKLADQTPGIDGDGSIGSPLDNIKAATEQARSTLVMPVGGGADVSDGEFFVVSDGVNPDVRFEFDDNGFVAPGAFAVSVTSASTRAELAAAVAAAIEEAANETPTILNVTATVAGATVRVGGIVKVDASGSPALLSAPSIVRIIGNGGSDGDVSTLGNNRPYLLGLDGLTILADGAGLEVPQGVTVMVDAGALFKLSEANLDVGSSAVGIDRREGALQVLGTPGARVLFDSYRNDAVGGDSDGPAPSPQPGDWGGLVFRADSDRENEGIYLNWVNQAEIVRGGGKLLVESVEETFTPIHLVGARPTIANNIVRLSADAAISADPLSFEDSGDRIGPDIHSNTIINNTLNGLFVRIRTELGEAVDRITLPSRFDDRDIVHVLTENLLIEATPGGPRKDAATGIVNARIDGSLKIDPGIILKIEGARIEVLVGGQLIAEGDGSRDVIFTAINDDSYGGSGSFDTKNDATGALPGPGQWGGLFFNTTSEGSIDHAVIAYAGGLTPIEGGFDRFNAIEVHQADVRLTNSVIRNNDVGTSFSNRSGRGGNAATTFFVRGAQPVIIDNDFENNLGSVINVNANSLQLASNPDHGRQTGMIDQFDQFATNSGPLVALNRLLNNALNGMEVRPGVQTTETAWDDTSIAHVLRGEIQVLNHHTFSGLHLISGASESLVIKLAGPDAGFTANGTLLDIDDRIGGSIYIGGGGAPVILTALSDDTAAAGVDVFGQPLGDTDNNGPTTGTPGAWRSVRLDRYSNDRNVAVIREAESDFGGASDTNGTPQDAIFLGNLAPNEKSGDINRRLGFEIHGTISLTDATDRDVYSFSGVAGTEVYFDLDDVSSSLDTIVELIDANGTVVARSVDDDVNNLSGSALPLLKFSYQGDDYYTISERDAGMRVILPGTIGETNTYFVRVRSTPADGDIENVDGGLSRGAYQLQIRLQQRDEKPGSYIDGADIRFATNGIEVIGLPSHSPLLGESVETRAGNDALGAAQPLGNLLTTDRSTLAVGGNLTAPTDIDWYSFQIDYEFIQSIGGRNDGDKTWATIFDIDYADGLARGDTVLSVFDDAGNLVLVSRDSHIDDDQPGAGQGADTDDLTRGTFGTLDPFIGSVQMPAGATRTYFVAVSSNSQLPQALNGNFTAGAANRLVRLEPVNSLERIAEDHIGFEGYLSGNFNAATPVLPRTSIFDISTSVSLQTNVVPFTLNDVVLYTARPGDNGLQSANPFTGAVWTDVGDLPTNNPARAVTDIKMRSDGRLYAYESLFGQAGQNTAGRLIEIDPSTGAQTVVGNDAIPDFNPATNPPDLQQLTSDAVQAFAWQRTGANTPRYNLWYAVEGARRGPGIDTESSTLYRANDASGSAAVAQGQPWGRVGEIFANTPGDLGVTTGMAYAGGQLFGVSDRGFFYQINTGSGQASIVASLGSNFSGLTEGPQNLEGGRFQDILFAVTTAGDIFALDTGGNVQGEFQNGTSATLTSGSSVGITFSPMDFNLWHPTMQRRGDAGHGINPAFDQSRDPGAFEISINGRESDQAEGGASFYFGFEPWVQNPDTSDTYFDYNGINAQYGILAQATHQDLTQNPRLGDNYDFAGGAFGSLQTNSIDLSRYEAADKPTIYFNYFLETENANTITSNDMRDSARVLVSANGGATWELLATNNSILSTAARTAELPRFISPSVTASTHPRQQVQELFDNTGGWRQARIDLSNYAGLANLEFRFDFSTAAAFPDRFDDTSINGDLFDQARAQNNDFEGFYVDDVIIGFAERGEMVTNSPAQSTFFTIPPNPDPGDPAQILVGEYQLEIRRGTEYAESIDDLNPDIIHFQTFDTNTRLVQEFLRLGDDNQTRDQGQVLIANNTISQSLQFGVRVDAGPRDASGSLQRPGGARVLPTINSQRLVAGVNVENNVISNFGTGGILFSGDPNAGTDPLAPVPFGRIMNNTVYGGTTARGIAIQVTENASPTILNNIVANTVSGIAIDGTSSSTVVGANLFSGNTANGTIGQNAILLQSTDPLFVNPGNSNFYLAGGTLAVDSSLNSLADRNSFIAVNSPLGIPQSPILAPERDRFRQLRIDDPSQDPPPGLGANIFKDRGAIERADFSRPFVQLVAPEDNDAAGEDLNPALTEVLVDAQQLDEILISLVDVGVGIDESSILPGSVSVSFDGALLVEGVDYDFVYFSNGRVISLQNLPDNPQGRSRYDITFDNSSAGIVDLAGNLLDNNRPDGSTAFTVISGVAPEAIDDTAVVDEDASVLIDVLANDVEVGSPLDPASIVVIGASNGTGVVSNGQILYTPNPDFFGTDILSYRVSDEAGRVSNTGEVTLTINPINDPPIGVDDPAFGTIMFLEDGPTSPVAIPWDRLVANDLAGPANELGQVLSIASVASLNGDPASQVAVSVTNDPTNRVVLVTPQLDGNGIAKFVYFVQDDQAEFNTALVPATVTLEFLPVNDAPLTDPNQHASRNYNVDEDPLELTPPVRLQINAADIEADDRPAPLTAIDELATQTVRFASVIAASENGGTVTYNPTTGIIEYVPAKDFFGTDFVYYRMNDELLTGGNPKSWIDNGDGTFSLVDDLLTSIGTIAVTVNPRNDPPQFISSTLEALEDNTISIDDLIGLFGITGGPGGETEPVLVTLGVNALHGDVSVEFDSSTQLYSLLYQPDPDFFGSDLFVLTLTDVPNGTPPLTVQMPVTVVVRPVNDEPLGNPNSINLIEGQARTIPVSLLLGNDAVDNVGPEGTAETSAAAGNRPQQLKLKSIAFAPGTPSGGSIQLSADGRSVTILPPPNYYSTDGMGNVTAPNLQIVYTLEDDGITYLLPSNNVASAPQSDPLTATASVTATVYPTNNPPIAKTHQILGLAKEDTRFTIATSLLIPTDGLVDSLPIGGAIPGNLDSAGVGEDLGPNGIKDAGESLTQRLSVLSPVAGLSRISTTLGGTVEFVVNPATGKVENLLYTPPVDFASVPAANLDSFNYRILDDGKSFTLDTNGNPVEIPGSAKSSIGRVEIQVQPLNDRPQFNTSSLLVGSQEDSGVNFIDRFAFNITAAPISAVDEIDPITGQKVAFTVTPLSFTANQASQFFAQLPAISPDGDLTFRPADNAFGQFLFEVILVDDGPNDPLNGEFNSSIPVTMTINVAAVNDPPTFVAGGPVTIDEDAGPYSQGWASSISVGPPNESSQTVGFEVITPPNSLNLFEPGRAPSITPDGKLQFTTATNANGVATVQVTAVDSEGGRSQSVQLTITVKEVNDPPIARPDAIDTDEDRVLVIPSSQLLDNDIDPDLITNPNESLRIVMPNASFSLSGASVTFDPATGEITYDPTVSSALQALAPGQKLVDSFAYSVRDAAGLQSNVTTVALTVTGINDAPRVQFDSPQLNPSGPTVIRVLDNDVDVDGFIVASTLRIELPPAFGSAEIQPDGTILYTSFGGSSQEDVFTYTVADNLGLRSRTALVTISSNASPIAGNDAKTTFLDEAIVIDVAANDSDPDGSLNLASIQIVRSPLRGQAIPQANGTVQYVPNPGFLGRDSFQYQISDDLGRPSNVATVVVEVLASRLQNPDIRFDVNDDGKVTALDSLLIINHLSRADGAISIPVLPTDRGPNYYDVNGNKQISSSDALAVINELARINNGSGLSLEQVALPASGLVTSPSEDAVSRLLNAPVALAETLKGAAKIVNVGTSVAIHEELVDLIATSQDETDEEGYREALDAAFAALL